jgi:peptidoglycan/xylan/chitin deacetylase (PgdA/CDA1 family)
MDDLCRLAKPISIDKRGNLEPGIHHVVITFDDGFYSFVENALPELTQRKIPVTIFVPAGKLGEKPDWVSINYINFRSEIVMTSDQLMALAENTLVTVGSHCLTHKNISCLEEKEVINELCESKQTLEGILKKKVELLSFPFGSYTQKHLGYARLAGYRHAFGILPTMAFCESDEYVTGRVDVEPRDCSLEFRLKVLGAYRWLPTASSLKHKFLCVFRCKSPSNYE